MRTPKRKRQRQGGFTLVELLVVVAVITILAVLLTPVLAQAREKARQARCMSNLRQIAVAMALYVDDNAETYPRDVTRCSDGPASDPCSQWNPHQRLEARLQPYLKDTAVFACPSATTPPAVWDAARGVCTFGDWGYPEFFCFPGDTRRGKPLSYGWNELVFSLCVTPSGGGCDAPGIALAAVAEPAGKLMVADSREPLLDPMVAAFANYPGASPFYAGNVGRFWPEFPAPTAPEPPIVPALHARHQQGQNVAFLDGHVRWMPYQQLTGPSIDAMVGKWLDYLR